MPQQPAMPTSTSPVTCAIILPTSIFGPADQPSSTRLTGHPNHPGVLTWPTDFTRNSVCPAEIWASEPTRGPSALQWHNSRT